MPIQTKVEMNINKNELMQELFKYDKYDMIVSDVLGKLDKLKTERALQMHPYKITPPKDENGRWQTYIDTEDGRKKIVKKKEQDLYNALKDYYLEDQNKNVTLKGFYPEWMKKKDIDTGSAETLRRHNQHWIKYYLVNDIINVPLQKITKEMIETFFHITIKDYKMSRKELNNMKVIFKNVMSLACERNIIRSNPFNEIQLNNHLCRHVLKKSNKTQVYFQDEQEQLFIALDEDYAESLDSTNTLAVKLLFQLGTRIGEVVATKWSDIEDNDMHIQRMEMKDSQMKSDMTFAKTEHIIVDHVKTNNDCGDRFLHLTPAATELLEQIKEINERMHYSDDDFIFCGLNGRTTRSEIAYCIKKACTKAGIPNKSSHDIRRTVASILHINHVPLDEIRRILGHQDEKTTLGYIFNPYSDEVTKNLLDTALCGEYSRVLKKAETKKHSSP